jgi:hypothetical protein
METFSNDPHGQPQITTVRVSRFDELVSIARSAYGDLRIAESHGLGGINALVLLSAERNRVYRGFEPRSCFALYNLSALGLRYSGEPTSLSNATATGIIEIVRVVAQPGPEEVWDGDSGVDETLSTDRRA